MTTATATAGSQPVLQATGNTMLNVIRSEWTKLWSVRSTRWTLLSTILVTWALTVLIAWGTVANWDEVSPQDRATFDPTSQSLAGIVLGQFAIAVLGALVITSEYSTGGIRTTFTAVPARLKVLSAKFVTFLVVALVTGLLTSFVAFFLGQLFYATKDVEAHLSDPHVLRAVIGGGLYIAGSGMFGFAFGALLRKTAAAISVAIAMLFVLPLLSNALPGKWGDTITRYFTMNAGSHITDVRRAEDALSPWAGYAVFTLEWALVLAVGAYLVNSRDA
jgi:ABC-2 type transport system permease protein